MKAFLCNASFKLLQRKDDVYATRVFLLLTYCFCAWFSTCARAGEPAAANTPPANAPKKEFVTLMLDEEDAGVADVLCAEPPTASAASADGTRSAQPSSSAGALSPSEAELHAGDNVRGIRIYSFGKPLQVNRSYAEDHQEAARGWRNAAAQAYAANAIETPAYYEYSWNQGEVVNRYRAGLYLPVREEWALTVLASTASYTLEESTDDENGFPNYSYRHADMTELDIGGRYSFSPELNAALAILAGGTDELITPGLRASGAFAPAGGISFSGEGRLWVPWGDNTLSVLNNGRSSGLTLNASLPLLQRLDLSLSFSNDWRYLAESALVADSYQGMETTGQGRLSYAIIDLPRNTLPVTFRNRETLTGEAPATGLNIFSSLLAGSYFNRPDETPVPVTEHRFEQRFGLSASAALASCLAFTAEGYVGYDTEREIDFGKLYGFSSQFDFIPASWLRIYSVFGMDSEAANGLIEGKTWRAGGGMNLKF